MTYVAYIALGSDLGDRHLALTRARSAIATVRTTSILALTEIEETGSPGQEGQRHSLRQMVAVRTSLAPRVLVAALHRIERAAGRVRAVTVGPRNLELDIVMIEGREVADDALATPHEELPNRELWRHQLAQLRDTTSG